MRKFFFAFFLLVSSFLFAQENIDSQVFNMSIDLKVQDGTSSKVVSDHKAQHHAVTGRPVILNINGGNFKASVRFTLYRMSRPEDLMLLTQSSIYFMKDGQRRMLSTAKSIPVKLGEKVLFFPLGVLNNGEKSDYNCVLEMEITKHQQQPASQE